MDWFRYYAEVWAVDFEFTAPPGGRQVPLCCVAREVRTGRLERLWLGGSGKLLRIVEVPPPYGLGADSLILAYYASAELGCHLALGWPTPTRILDLHAEFRCVTSGLPVPCGHGLLGALAYHGLEGIGVAEKESMRDLALRGGPYTDAEQTALLDYCQTDVDALARLLPAMGPWIDFPRALLRGRYMAAAARMEWLGVPIDVETLKQLRGGWDAIKGRLVAAVDERYGVFEPVGRRELNPDSPSGSAVLKFAEVSGVDPHALADAAEIVWREEREATAESAEALRLARKATGLDARRIGRWEESGKDHSTWPDLDVAAHDLAGALPALGIGRGYDPDAADEGDHAALLWERLREPAEPPRPKHHPDILRRAAELATGSDPAWHGPVRFSAARWADYLAHACIPWPRLESGALALDDDTFREMSRLYPEEVGPVRELRHALSQMRLNELAVGPDGRNRCLLSAFGSRTGRNQPSNARFIFGPSAWLRSLIKPEVGRAVAYVDWEQQEFGIAAALSGDPAMMEAYRSGDPYLAFARQAGAVPADATKQTHKAEREQFKVCALAVQYGMIAEGLARKLGVPAHRARELLALHRRTYPRYWQWSDAVQDEAMLTGRLRTVFGWAVHVGTDANPRSLRNFPMQANGAEMLRLACCLATERGIGVCCPVHDALLVEGPADGIDAVVAATQQAMREASELVLPGFPLRTDAKVVRYPDRYSDDRGRGMWDTVQGLLADDDGREWPVAVRDTHPSRIATGTCREPLDPVHTFFIQEGSFLT
jgi:hypothetical protein